jgi:hypothetical protein
VDTIIHVLRPVVDMLTRGYSNTPALVKAFRSWLLSCASVRADSSKVTTVLRMAVGCCSVTLRSLSAGYERRSASTIVYE